MVQATTAEWESVTQALALAIFFSDGGKQSGNDGRDNNELEDEAEDDSHPYAMLLVNTILFVFLVSCYSL